MIFLLPFGGICDRSLEGKLPKLRTKVRPTAGHTHVAMESHSLRVVALSL